MTISEDRADRIEAKIDVLTTAVNRLAVIDERQIEHGKRTGQIEDRIAKLEEAHKKDVESIKDKLLLTDKKVDRWIHMGMGAWAIVVTLWGVYQTVAPMLRGVKGP